MEWLYGLLAGSSFTAILMHLAHVGHMEQLRKDYENEGYKVRPNGMIEPKVTEPWSVPRPCWDSKHSEFAHKLDSTLEGHIARADVVDKLDDVPTNCTCDWHGEQTFCEAEPNAWYRSRKDPECPRHRADDQ